MMPCIERRGGIEEGVDLNDGGLRRALEEILPVVEDHQVSGPEQAGFDPLHVVRLALGTGPAAWGLAFLGGLIYLELRAKRGGRRAATPASLTINPVAVCKARKVFTTVLAAKILQRFGRVAELADAKDLGSFGVILAGSTPVAPTILTVTPTQSCPAACW
jgi:hypothetical protein